MQAKLTAFRHPTKGSHSVENGTALQTASLVL
jgi:hypothetical protein